MYLIHEHLASDALCTNHRPAVILQLANSGKMKHRSHFRAPSGCFSKYARIRAKCPNFGLAKNSAHLVEIVH